MAFNEVSNLDMEKILISVAITKLWSKHIYFQEIQDFTLKAPIGGFRIKPVWSGKTVVFNKPSATIMLHKKIYETKNKFWDISWSCL
jgi:hypothetical protein